MTVSVISPPLEQDDRPPPQEMDSADAYLDERSRELDADVLQGIRELDGADGIKWSVSRVGEEDPGRNGFLVKLGTSQLTGEYLRNKFGGGRYYVRGNYPNGKYAAHRTFEIATDAPRTGAPAAGVTAQNGSSFDVPRFLMEQEAREESRAEKRRARMMETITVVGPIVAPIVAAMLGRQGTDVTALIAAMKPPDPIQTLVALKELAGGSGPDPLDRAMKVIDMINDRAPSGSETGMLDLVKEAIRALAPSVAPMIEAKLAESAAARAAAARPALPAPSGTSSGPAAGSSAPALSPQASPSLENPQMFGMLGLLPWLKTQLAVALQKAQDDSPPELIADRILDDLPRAYKENPAPLREFIVREDWFIQLCRVEPRCGGHQGWFTDMRNAMLDTIDNAGKADEGELPADPALAVSVSGDGVQSVERPSGIPSLTGK